MLDPDGFFLVQALLWALTSYFAARFVLLALSLILLSIQSLS